MAKARPTDHTLIRDPAADPIEREAAIMRLGSDRRYDLESVFRQLLEDPQPVVRAGAYSVLLAYWCRDDVVPRALAVLSAATDADDGFISERATERIDVAGILGVYGCTCPCDATPLVRALMKKLETHDHSEVLRACYTAILTIVGAPEAEKWGPHPFVVEQHVKWTLIEDYLSEPGTLGRPRNLFGTIAQYATPSDDEGRLSVPERFVRFASPEAQQRVAARYALARGAWMQDWAAEAADATRLPEFIAGYARTHDPEERFVLMELIINSMEFSNDMGASHRAPVRELLERDAGEHASNIVSFACLEQTPDGAWRFGRPTFELTYWMREILVAVAPAIGFRELVDTDGTLSLGSVAPFSIDAFERATPSEREDLCNQLAAALTTQAQGRDDFYGRVRALVDELVLLGHDLYGFDEDGEEFAIWAPNYARPGSSGIVVTFRLLAPTEVAWIGGSSGE